MTTQGDDFVPIPENDRNLIKNVLVDLMLSVEPSISKTLAEALSIISETEFPHDWPTLLPVCREHPSITRTHINIFNSN